MSGFILDASVAVSWLVRHESESESLAALNKLRQDGAVVPQLWHYEVRNALLVAERRGRIAEGAATSRLRNLDGLPIVTDRNAQLDDAMELAFAHELSYYDALYLELASRLGLPLATFDSRLVAATNAFGLQSFF